MMKLRRHVFALLDRSLLLSEAKFELGVKMHDAVRDYARSAGEPRAVWDRDLASKQ